MRALFVDAASDPVDPASPLADFLLPGGLAFATGVVPERYALGRYAASVEIPMDAVLGTWLVRWQGVIDGVPSVTTEEFEVRDVGLATTGDDTVDQNIAITMGLIEHEPTEVVLMRPPTAVSDGEGGSVRPVGTDTPQPAQTLFVSGVTRDSDYRQSSYIVTEQGEKFVNAIVVIGLPGANIKQDDWFLLRGERIKIKSVAPDQRWQVKAEGERVTSGGD